jgi:hypothetical protein
MSTARIARACGAFGGAFLTALVLVQPGAASDGLAIGASSPALRVDAKDTAEVSWTTGGTSYSFVVPESGLGYHGALAGADALKRTSATLPMAVAEGATPDGTHWALQQLDVSGRPASLDLSRWKRAPTALTLATDGKRVTGTATFDGHPVTGTSPTQAGKEVRAYVYLECFGCPGDANGWMLMAGVAPKADGSFALYLRSSWAGKRYRATIAGPNVGGMLAPDAQTVINAAS